MNRTLYVAQAIVGVVGAVVTGAFVSAGEFVFAAGPLRFDPYVVTMAGFVALGVLGVWAAASTLPVVRRTLGGDEFAPEEVLFVVAIAVATGILAALFADVSGTSLLVTVALTMAVTALVVTGVLFAAKRAGLGSIEFVERDVR